MPAEPPDPRELVVVTGAEAYLGEATLALGRRFSGAQVEQLAPEVATFSHPDLGLSQVAEACRDPAGRPPLPFVRHLARARRLVTPHDLDQVGAVAAALVSAQGERAVAVQVWGSGKLARRPPDVREDVVSALERNGVATSRGGLDRVVTVCLTPAGALVGLTPASLTLADWPGGKVVLGRSPAQISRAEWKLEELYKLEVLDRPPEGRRCVAMDLGAAPGGWTRILRSVGYEVWAIDPGELDERLSADRGVHHVATTAGRFLAEPGEPVDLVVNDMRMEADRSCQVLVDAAPRLRRGGRAVITLKVGRRRPTATVQRALKALSQVYEPEFARQLFHNRNEVTVVVRRRG